MRHALLSDDRLAELLRRYPHESNAELAADFRITPHQAACLASYHRIKKTAATTSRLNGCATGISAEVLKLAQARGEAGIDRAEAIAALPHLRSYSIGNALALLSDGEQIHRAGRRRSYRWFADLRHALAHNAYDGTSTAPTVKTARARGPAHDAGAPVITAASRVTVCPPTGWRAQAAAPADGLFSTLQPGRYLDAEAKPWITAATTKGQHP